MSNQDVAKAFVEGRTAASGSMFTTITIAGAAVYSYGFHFPIAFRSLDGHYYVNTDKYSRTTSIHQGLVSREIGPSSINRPISYMNTEELKTAINGMYQVKTNLSNHV